MSFKNKIIPKPWGHEFLMYENDDVGLWILHLNPEQQTSMHCHTEKTTGLVVLDGEILLSFISDNILLKKGQKRMIRRGLFHSSKNVSSNKSIMLEIETPKNKTDLVRLHDSYGRELTSYESSYIEDSSLPWIDSPNEKTNSYKFEYASCTFEVNTITNVSQILDMSDEKLIIFLNGGIVTKHNQNVIIPGDVGFLNIVKKVCKEIPFIRNNTLTLTISI